MENTAAKIAYSVLHIRDLFHIRDCTSVMHIRDCKSVIAHLLLHIQDEGVKEEDGCLRGDKSFICEDKRCR